MRDWTLGAGDPLYLTLGADARLGAFDYFNDHIWELEVGGGDPPALALRTTYGLRARAMRIFLRFGEGKTIVTDPAAFTAPPRLRRFHPNFLAVDLVPIQNLGVTAEFWIPESHAAAARLTFENQSNEKRKFAFEVCATLAPLDGQSLASTQQQLVHILAGQTGGLVPVVFVTGGPKHGPGPHASLLLDVELDAGQSRTFTMAQAATDTLSGSFELTRRTAARPWEAERARIERLHAADAVEIETGDPNWDAVLAFSQSAALGLACPGGLHLPQMTFVGARQPDLGFSRKGDGSDFPPSWTGVTTLEAQYLANVLPGATSLAKGSILNFLSTQRQDGELDHKPGPAGQRSKLLSAPMLATLAWNFFESSLDEDFLAETYPKLKRFFEAWLSVEHDRDNDGAPEWDHVMQTGFEDNPLFDVWNPWSQGLSISLVHSPSLLAMLYSEARSLSHMANRLGRPAEELSALRDRAVELKRSVLGAWSARSGLYLYRDRETDTSQRGRLIAKRRGAGNMSPHTALDQPARLLIEVQTKSPAAKRPQLEIMEDANQAEVERLDGHEFQWRTGGLVATSQRIYSRVDLITARGLESGDRVVVRTVDTAGEDLTLALPLWAGIPTKPHAQAMMKHALLDSSRFERPCGLSVLPWQSENLRQDESVPTPGTADTQPLSSVLSGELAKTPPRLSPGHRKGPRQDSEAISMSVHMPWNALVAQGMLRYGYRAEAARLFTRLMNAVTMNLKINHSFYQRYHAERGAGLGERNSLHGLAPVGLFLETLGVRVLSAGRVRLEDKNVFPWPVTIRYRGLTIVRGLERTVVTFPNGQSVTVRERTPCIVSM
jgi:hypothetical protein